MKAHIYCLFILFVIQSVCASVSVRVCGPNEIIPFDFSNIMVGQELTLIVSSDPNDYWSGAFFIEGQDRALGSLSARDSDPNLRDYTDSHYPAAGDYADVFAWRDSDIWGFDMYSSDSNCLPGDWFIIDYKAEQAGSCQVDFYDYNSSWTEPNMAITFNQDPSCDFNGDGYVNFQDFNKLSSYWLKNCGDCSDVNDCLAVDLDFDFIIDVNDLNIFVRHWLWDGSLKEPEVVFVPTPDPNLIYSITDANGFDEIYLNPGQSTRLYINLSTSGQSNIMSFDIDVQISDPNYGSIVNTTDPNTVDPNDMPFILATPRHSGFDIIGPGVTQQDGIHMSAYNFTLDPNNAAMNDGYLASFVYTATASKDVELNILNMNSTGASNETVYPTTKPILIHQTTTLESSYSESMLSYSTMSTSTDSEQESTSDMSIDEMISFLEQIYKDDKDFQKSIDPIKWDNFLDSIRESYNNTY